VRQLRIVLVAIAVAVTALGAGHGVALYVRSGRASADFIDFALADLDGTERHLSHWRGRPLVLNFWATWCAPCREEIPLLIDLQKRYADRGLQVVGVAIDRPSSVAAYRAEFGINYPILLADEDTFDVMKKYGNATGALPYTVIFDSAGNVSQRKLGAFRTAELEDGVLTSLAKPQK